MPDNAPRNVKITTATRDANLVAWGVAAGILFALLTVVVFIGF